MRRVLPLVLVLIAGVAHAQVRDRVFGHINSDRAELHGNVHPLARGAADRGPAPASLPMPRITIFFNRTPAQQAELEELLRQQQDPSSANYHRWLTPAEFGDRFGISAADYTQVAAWLEAQGFRLLEMPRSRSYIAVSGTAAQVESAMRAQIHRVEMGGELHFANLTDPELPAAIAGAVLHISGLHDFRLRARAVRRGPRPMFTSNLSGNHFLTPDDFATIYHLKPLYDLGIDGTGQTIAVMGQTDIAQSDINAFRSASGLPPSTVTKILIPGGTPGVATADVGEADLDVEWAGATAPKASVIYVNAGAGANDTVLDALGYAISNNTAPVISISYGDCEPHFSKTDATTLYTETQQASAQGQTVVGPSGDSGAADCDFSSSGAAITSATHGKQVDLPAGLPNVTGVGGTQFQDSANPSQFWAAQNNSFNGSALSYIPEMAWNETVVELQSGGSISGTGGGADKDPNGVGYGAKPVWQLILTPADGARDVPDISFSASFHTDDYLICSQGDCVNGFRNTDNTLDAVGGTSASTPSFAGIVALINQKMAGAQGNINPRLYQLAGTSTDAFHDVTAGDNIVPCTSGTPDCPAVAPFQFGFAATAGYDRATGLGSVDAYNLISEWPVAAPSPPAPPDFSISSASQSVTVTHGSSAPVTVTIAGSNGFSGSVTLSCIVPTSLAGVTCSFPTNPVGTGDAIVMINASSTASLAPLPGASPASFAWLGGGAAVIVGLVFSAGGNGRKRRLMMAGMLLLLALALSLAGCGGSGGVGPSPTPTPTGTPESGTIVIQGVSQADVHIATVNVTVN